MTGRWQGVGSRGHLKVHLHEIFYLFFSSKAPTWSPYSYPKFVSNIKSNSPRYSNYLSLGVDSVNAELIFCFYKYYPFKGARAAYVRLFWIDSSPSHWVNAKSDSSSTESTRSETPCQLSQRGVRLHVNWVNAEGTNIYEDFIIPRWSVDVESHSALTQLTWNLTWLWLSWRGMRLCVNWVTAEL